MTKAGLAEIVVVMDRSSSMASMRDEAISAFNTFIEEQKIHPGEARFTLTLFNTQYDTVYKGKDIKDVPKMTLEVYRPAGCTALLDAVGKTIDEVGERLEKTDEAERPERVVFVIITDGQENSSKEYDYAKVTKLIKQQTDDYQWEFVFLAAGMSAASEAANIGISVQNLVKFDQTPEEYSRNISAVSCNVSNYRSTGKSDWQNTDPESS